VRRDKIAFRHFFSTLQRRPNRAIGQRACLRGSRRFVFS
jgi:hypothetical protein